jgi:hypothetical protein
MEKGLTFKQWRIYIKRELLRTYLKLKKLQEESK